ncbi:MAG: hypothetical protein CO189_01365 [candidate division Zixibacteria bacterium CG_4_9_14_3_um_filter_46_8]|nr:MAG: hypothetical protein CO189_01365 [candidate division Zixibacteria bacterium CG_4_9_14_3_um_filter_46_8]
MILKQDKKALLWYAPALLYAILVVCLSSIPQLTAPNIGFEPGDKVLHFIEYFIFAILWYKALTIALGGRKIPIYKVLLIYGVVFAALDETHQYFVPNRDMDFWDFLADFAGLLSWIGILAIWRKARKKSAIRKAIDKY